MKQLILWLALLLPIFAQGQNTNGTIQRQIASPNIIRGLFGSTADTIPSITGTLTNGYVLKYNSTLKKWYAAAESGAVMSVTAGNGLTPNTSQTGAVAFRVDTSSIQTVSNFFPKGDTRWLRTTTASSTYQTIANLSTDLTSSTTKYPSVNAVNTGLSFKADINNPTFTGIITTPGIAVGMSGINMSGATASTDAVFDATKGLISNAVTGSGNSVRSVSPSFTGGVSITGLSTATLASGSSGAALGIGRSANAYNFWLGLDASSHFNIYDNNGTTSLLRISNTTGLLRYPYAAAGGNRFIMVDNNGDLITGAIGSNLSYTGGVVSATGSGGGSGITGSMTSTYIPVATGASTVGNSIIQDLGGGVLKINGAVAGASSLTLYGNQASSTVGVNVAQNGDWTMPSKAILTTSPTASAGGFEYLTRNTSTGAVEKLTSITASMVGAPSGSGTSTGTNTGDQDLSGLMPKSGGTFTGAIAGTTATFSGDVTANSDRRLKKHIRKLKNVSTSLRGMTAYLYKMKGSDVEKIGLIAQEVKKYYPQLVKTDEKGILSVNYQAFTAVLLQGWKELDDRLTKLEQK